MVSSDKERIAITITKEQAKLFSEVATEMGISKSILMQIATIQYVNAYRQSKSVVSDTLGNALAKVLESNDGDLAKLRSILAPSV